MAVIDIHSVYTGRTQTPMRLISAANQAAQMAWLKNIKKTMGTTTSTNTYIRDIHGYPAMPIEKVQFWAAKIQMWHPVT